MSTHKIQGKYVYPPGDWGFARPVVFGNIYIFDRSVNVQPSHWGNMVAIPSFVWGGSFAHGEFNATIQRSILQPLPGTLYALVEDLTTGRHFMDTIQQNGPNTKLRPRQVPWPFLNVSVGRLPGVHDFTSPQKFADTLLRKLGAPSFPFDLGIYRNWDTRSAAQMPHEQAVMIFGAMAVPKDPEKIALRIARDLGGNGDPIRVYASILKNLSLIQARDLEHARLLPKLLDCFARAFGTTLERDVLPEQIEDWASAAAMLFAAASVLQNPKTSIYLAQDAQSKRDLFTITIR